ncbi:MAG TPA: GerMN domain-containing protein [Thermoleophilia bacterium]|nr:GerMN domain-containing protein [Thermoleophilia bacterium]
MSRRTLILILVTVAAALAFGVSACGDGDEGTGEPTAEPTSEPTATTSPAPTQEPSGETVTVLVYFLSGEKLATAERTLPATQAVARAAMDALCGGPNDYEEAAGLTSSAPEGTQVLGISVKDRVATVDLSGEYASGGGSLSMMTRVAQVVYTLTQFDTIRAVRFHLDGKPVEAIGGEGIIVDSPQRRADWEDFEPVIFVERPGVGATVASPVVISGRATVFEATIQLEVRDADDKILARGFTTATRGAPDRGRFRERLAYAASTSTEGFVIAYEQSMEDGSRLNEVRVPVFFPAAQ